MSNKRSIDIQADARRTSIDKDAEREGAALKRQGRYTQSRYCWIKLQEGYKQAIEAKAFKG